MEQKDEHDINQKRVVQRLVAEVYFFTLTLDCLYYCFCLCVFFYVILELFSSFFCMKPHFYVSFSFFLVLLLCTSLLDYFRCC